MKRITIHISTKDRWSELGLLLQSLRTQTYKDWDIIILDDASGTPIVQCHFLTHLINRVKLENHKVKTYRHDVSFGVCHARNKCIEIDDFENELIIRLDDDVIIEPDYLERLVKVIDSGYDISSGITPQMGSPILKRESKYIKPIINKIEINSEGDILKLGDDCGYGFIEDEIIPSHHLRSCFMYKREIHDKIKYENNLTTVGFREEAFFCLRAIILGYKIGIDTHATAFHFQTPSGGVRTNEYGQKVNIDEDTFRRWFKNEFKKNGDFIKKYNEEVIKNDEEKKV